MDNPEVARKNSKKAVELLKKSAYADKLTNAGLFLLQLQSQKPALRQLISARLGNQVYLTSQLLQSAPRLTRAACDRCRSQGGCTGLMASTN